MAKKALKKDKSAESASTREKIVRAAIRCYERQGIAATRSVDIAKEAGVAPPLFSYYYPSAENLFADVMQVSIDSLRDATVQALEKNEGDVRRAMERYVRVPFEWASKNRGLYSIRLYFFHLASFSERFETLSRDNRQIGRDRIAMMLYQGLEKGVFKLPPGLQVQDAAMMIQSLITGATLIAGTEGSKNADWERMAKSTWESVKALIQK